MKYKAVKGKGITSRIVEIDTNTNPLPRKASRYALELKAKLKIATEALESIEFITGYEEGKDMARVDRNLVKKALAKIRGEK